MKGLERLLKDEKQRLVKIQNETERRLCDAPEGTLRITKTGDRVQHMNCIDGDEKSKRQGVYLKKSEFDTVKKLAQKAYDKKIKRLVDKRIKQIQALVMDYKDTEISEIYDNLSDVRKKLVVPVEKSWEQRVAEWKAIPYAGKAFTKDIPEIYTKKGERVRSKTEKIIADIFYELGIEYKYECPLVLKSVGTVYPDFTILSKKTGEEIYWEHDGRMDDPEYSCKAVRKIDDYMKNGIFPGEKLIITYETSNYVLSDRIIKMLINRYLMDINMVK